MKRLFGIIVLFSAIICFSSCGGNYKTSKAASHPYNGTFTIKEGITFTLNEDSTTYIDFGDGVDYKGMWEIVHEDGEEWANIEFSGNKQYYYLKNGKLYRSHMEMDFDKLGSEVTYQD